MKKAIIAIVAIVALGAGQVAGIAPEDACQVDRARLTALGDAGVLAMLGDSTNAMLPGRTQSEATTIQPIHDVVGEAPGRAVDMLLYKDMQRHESAMRLVERQIPQAKAFYDAQSPEVQARIDQRLEEVQPYYKEKAFVGEVLREMNRKNRQILTAPKPGMSMSAG